MKRILIFLLATAVTAAAMAIPARPGIKCQLTLADGSTVTAELRGDEAFHYYVLPDGTPLVRNTEGRWQASTTYLVQARHSQLAQRRNRHRLARAAKMQSYFGQQRRVKGQQPGQVTKKKGLVILVNFRDTKFLSTSKPEYFDQMFNGVGNPFGKNYGSVHEYFLAQSYGLFDLEFDVVGPYDLPYGMNYYGKDTDPNDKGSDAHPEEMVSEACRLADADVNYQDYDWDGDGEVEQVYVFFAGYGQNSGAATNTIWAHEWTLSDAYYYNNDRMNYSLRLDGMRIDTYACGSELYGTSGNIIDGVGTTCHEFSHCLGLPDFYDTSGTYMGMDVWDVMDYGCYNGDGYQPAGYTAYERWFSGWLEPIVLTEPLTVTDMPAIQDQPVAYVLMQSGTKANVNSTYYLMYNHQLKGWDEASYGHGMLVQWVRYNRTAWDNNTVNNGSKQRMTLVPADGDFNMSTLSALAGDPWPGTTGNTSFSWNGHTVTGITERNNLIGFRFDGGTPLPPLPVPVVNPDAATTTSTTFTAVWEAVEGAFVYNLHYHVLADGEDPATLLQDPELAWSLVRNISKTQYTVQRLKAGTTYIYQLQAIGIEGQQSDWSEAHVITLPQPSAIRTARQAMPATAGDIYDLSGRRTDGSRLRPGVYVIGGRKVRVQ